MSRLLPDPVRPQIDHEAQRRRARRQLRDDVAATRAVAAVELHRAKPISLSTCASERLRWPPRQQ